MRALQLIEQLAVTISHPSMRSETPVHVEVGGLHLNIASVEFQENGGTTDDCVVIKLERYP